MGEAFEERLSYLPAIYASGQDHVGEQEIGVSFPVLSEDLLGLLGRSHCRHPVAGAREDPDHQFAHMGSSPTTRIRSKPGSDCSCPRRMRPEGAPRLGHRQIKR